MTHRLNGRLDVLGRLNLLSRIHRGIPMCIQTGQQQQRWVSKTLLKLSGTSRFTVSTHTSLIPQAGSAQQGDSENLDRLAKLDEIFLVQKEHNIEETETNTRKIYKYEITDKMDEKLFNAVQMYETYPPKFDFKLYGPNGSILVTHKLFQNLSSHLLSMQIIRPGGMYVGSIEEKLNICSDENHPGPVFELKDSRDEIQAVVLTDFANTSYGLRRTIKILSADKSRTIGKISKRWGGFSDKLIVSITLPSPTDMNAQFRPSLIGLCILLVTNLIFKK